MRISSVWGVSHQGCGGGGGASFEKSVLRSREKDWRRKDDRGEYCPCNEMQFCFHEPIFTVASAEIREK